MSLPPQVSVANLIKTSPYRKGKLSQKNTTEHNAEINGSWAANSSRYTYITAPASLDEETLWKRGNKDSKRQYQKSSVEQSPRNGYINRTGITAKSMDFFHAKGKKFCMIQLIEKELRGTINFWEKKTWPLPEMSPLYWLSCAEWTGLKPNTHKEQKWTQHLLKKIQQYV